MEDHDKIGDDKGKTLKDFKKRSDTTTSSDELEKGKDSDHTAPIKRYGVSSDKWDKRYVGDSGKSYPNEYMDGIVDYEKYPHKRYRSDSEESNASPAYKRANIGNRSVKRQRSETDSDLSDDPPLSKRYKIDVQGGKKELAGEETESNENSEELGEEELTKYENEHDVEKCFDENFPKAYRKCFSYVFNNYTK